MLYMELYMIYKCSLITVDSTVNDNSRVEMSRIIKIKITKKQHLISRYNRYRSLQKFCGLATPLKSSAILPSRHVVFGWVAILHSKYPSLKTLVHAQALTGWVYMHGIIHQKKYKNITQS